MVCLRQDIVIGIDFGTTYSGVSWAVDEGRKDIKHIKDWPTLGDINANQDKVPSTISYNEGRVAGWGYEVNFKNDIFKWFKILLEPESKYAKTSQEVRDSNELLKVLNKTPEEVAKDFLQEIWKYTKEDIRKKQGDDWENTLTVHVILTVPAIWSHLAKEKTLKAAREANMPHNIELVTEPEAAALAALRDKAEENALKPGDTFVVCDAGGGTVDLISYKINCIKPLHIEECAVGDGGLCGSIFLDIAFEKHIRTLVGEGVYSKIKPAQKRRMMRMFEMAVKRSFTSESKNQYSVDLKGVEDNPDEGIEDDTIMLKKSTLCTIFDYVCGQIDSLVQEQVNQVEDHDSKVKAILLVGGFGASKYLHKRLENSYSYLSIKVLQINGAWSAICRGACIWGLEHIPHPELSPTITSKFARRSFGVSVKEPFNPMVHLEQDKQLDPARNTWVAINQMMWLLRIGEQYTENSAIKSQVIHSIHGVGFLSSGTQSFSTKLLYSKSPEPPSRNTADVKQLCQVDFIVPESTIWKEKSYRSTATAGKWRDMTFDLTIRVGKATLDFVVTYKGEPVGQVKAKYIEDF